MTAVTPSCVIPTLYKRVIVTVLRIAVLGPTAVISRKFGAVVRWNERLVVSLPVCTRRRSLRRGEVRVVSVPARIRLLWVDHERVLMLSTSVGCAGWILQLLVVAEDDVEEENGETDFDEEGENVGPGTPVPGSVTP